MNKSILTILVTILFSSCGSTNYYQIYKTVSTGGKSLANEIVFEDHNCRVTYDLWGSGGDIGFILFNKSEDDLTLDLENTFFVLNGIVYDYFQDRTFTGSYSSGTAVSSYGYPYYMNATKIVKGSTVSNSTTFAEKSKRIVPPGTSAIITEFRVVNSRFVHCDLPKFPSRNKIKTITFNKANTPYNFQNLITYSIIGNVTRMENSFYVTEVSNYPAFMVVHKVYKSDCGTQLENPVYKFNEVAPDKFYLEYFMNKK